jgi:two-component system OmpR family response regulator
VDNGHILVVDDQREICDLVQQYLSSEGYYRVSTAQDGAGMRRVMAQSPVDLVILDLILPGEDGLTLARSIRDETNVGIIILSGRGEPVERIIGLEMGADDYLPKPFLPRELLARVKSVLRRTSPRTTEKQAQARSKAQFAGWTLDLLRRVLYSPSDKEVDLTRGEFDLLAAFVKNPNQVLTRDRLLDREAGPEDRTIDVQVLRLRRKLKIDPKNPTIIKTVRGRGYAFIPEVQCCRPSELSSITSPKPFPSCAGAGECLFLSRMHVAAMKFGRRAVPIRSLS